MIMARAVGGRVIKMIAMSGRVMLRVAASGRVVMVVNGRLVVAVARQWVGTKRYLQLSGLGAPS